MSYVLTPQPWCAPRRSPPPWALARLLLGGMVVGLRLGRALRHGLDARGRRTQLRRGDGIHLTRTGGRCVAQWLIEQLAVEGIGTCSESLDAEASAQ